jgi:hypothetical protein
MWKNMVAPNRPQMTIQYGACALHAGIKATNSYLEYVLLIAFLQQQRLRKRASMLRYTDTAVLVNFQKEKLCANIEKFSVAF